MRNHDQIGIGPHGFCFTKFNLHGSCFRTFYSFIWLLGIATTIHDFLNLMAFSANLHNVLTLESQLVTH